jgi:transposase-like protein
MVNDSCWLAKCETRDLADLNGSFEPMLVNKHQACFGSVDKKILALDARGMTTRDIAVSLKRVSLDQSSIGA